MEAYDALHPTDQVLQSYGLGKLDDVLSHKVAKHLKDCPPCRNRAAEMSSDSFVGRLREAQGPAGTSKTDASEIVGPARKNDPTTASSHPPHSTTLPPELLDHPDYEIIRELGRGGMGVVYLVYNRLMARHEAIKVIGRQLMDRPTVLDRFLREIRSVAKIRHPNVVAAYSATRMGEYIVYAMEFVDGLDLARLVKRKGPLPVTHASYFIYQVALGLQHAHEHGIVHRDIKPGNLILTHCGDKSVVKVLDFGLTKATTDEQADHSLTREGQMLGTPDYIAPEQTLDAQSVDIRADIYSLGCTLYYLLSGRPPFRGGSLYEVLEAHHSVDAKPLNLVRPEVPFELAGVVAKMMAKKPRHRFQTPSEVAEALAPFFKKGKSTLAVPEPKPEFSVGGRASTHKAISASSIPTEPATSQADSLKQPPIASRPDSGWESLIELGEPESLTDGAPAISNAAPTPRWLWPSVAATVLVFGLIAALAAGVFSPKSADIQTADRTSGGERPRADDRVVGKAGPKIESPRQTAPAGRADAPASTGVAEAPNKPKPPPLVADRANYGATVALNRAETKLPRSPETTKSNSAGKPRAVDIRQIIVFPGIKRLANPNAVRPAAGFWPSLSPEDLTNWQIGDPEHITMNEKGLYLEAGPNGNLLVTRDAGYRKCVLTLTLSAKEGTEAFLALRVRHGPQGWQAVTARVHDEGGKIRAGHQAIDFQIPETGTARKDFAPGKPFGMKFEIDDKNLARVSVKGDKTSSATPSRPPANEDVGAVGLFVKSGMLMIERLDVQAK